MSSSHSHITILATWSFSRDAVTAARDSLCNGHSPLDALEIGINCIEENEKYGRCIVGIGGPRNSHGHLEMDAAVMTGQTLLFGAVTALQGFSRPVSVARAVMDHSPHSMLTSDGARIFAETRGFVMDTKLLSQSTQEKEERPQPDGHDTLGLIILDHTDIVCGVSTSGMPGKHPGRVGDSALPGNGLYADACGGAACCSGDGDFILKFCPAFQVVQHMKQGKSPQGACEMVIDEIVQRIGKQFEISIIAVNMKGEYGAGTTVNRWKDPLEINQVYSGFPFVVWTSDMDEPKCLCQKALRT